MGMGMGIGFGVGMVPGLSLGLIHLVEAGVHGAGNSMDEVLPKFPKMVEGAIWETVVCVGGGGGGGGEGGRERGMERGREGGRKEGGRESEQGRLTCFHPTSYIIRTSKLVILVLSR